MAFEIHMIIQYNLNKCYQPTLMHMQLSQIQRLQITGPTLAKYILLDEMKKQPIKTAPLQTNTVDLKSVVDVFIRNSRKQALLVHISPKTQIQQLNKAVATCFGIPTHDQVLMFKGKTLRDLLSCRLENKSIIHVIDRRNITPLLTIKIKKPQSQAAQLYSVSSSELVGDFIANRMKASQLQKPFLVHAGRRLKNNRSFSEQMVQNESELLCLHKKLDQHNLETIQSGQKEMVQHSPGHIQQPVRLQQSLFGLEQYLPKTRNKIDLQELIGSPETMTHLKDCSTQGNNKETSTVDNLKECTQNIPLKKTLVESSEPNLRTKIKSMRNNSSQGLLKGYKRKKSLQEGEIQSSQEIEGSNISEIAAKQHSADCKGEETCIFQCVLKGLINESLSPQQKQQTNQLNWSEGELMKIAAELQKWQEKMQIAKTTSKEADSSLEAVQLPLVREVKNTTMLDQTSYFSPIQPKLIDTKGQSPSNQHHLLFHKKDSRFQDLKDLLIKVENSPVKTRKMNSQQTDIIVQMQSMSSQNKRSQHPQSAILIDVSFGLEHGAVSSTLSKNKKLSQHFEQQGLENLQIKKQFYSTKAFQSCTNMYQTEIRVSSGQQKITQKQLIFRSQPFYLQPLQFYISMFEAELIQKTSN